MGKPKSRYARKPDKNQPMIVEAADKAGLSYYLSFRWGQGFPDIIVGGEMPCPKCFHRFPQNKLVEIKGEEGELTPEEEVFFDDWLGKGGQVDIVRTPEGLYQVCGR
jgi:hypothetical protein